MQSIHFACCTMKCQLSCDCPIASANALSAQEVQVLLPGLHGSALRFCRHRLLLEVCNKIAGMCCLA